LEIRSEILSKFIIKDIEFFDLNKSGELMSRITSDTAVIQTACSDNISSKLSQPHPTLLVLFRGIIGLVCSFVFLWIISWQISVLLILLLPIVLGCVGVFIIFMRRLSMAYQNKLALANSGANEALGNSRVVKSFSTEDKEIKQFYDRLFTAYVIGRTKSFFYSGFIGSTTFLALMLILSVLWLGGDMVIRGIINIG